MKTMAGRFDINILGGDTTGSKADLILNIAVTGEVEKNKMMRRNGAKPGDIVACTGFLGDSKAGLHLVLNRISPDTEHLAYLINAHILPEPHLRQGRVLASSHGVHSCIDVSDGLSSDLGHILKASRVGARIFSEKLPISRQLRRFCEQRGFDAISYALSGGEDYVLLCTISPDRADDVAEELEGALDAPLFLIGEITDSGEFTIMDAAGRARGVSRSGWDHFKTG
jgi:thiamine-monophosphate kinase